MTTAAFVGRQLSGYTLDPITAGQLRVLSPKEYLILQAAARRIVRPDGEGAPSADQVEVALGVDAYLARLPASVQREVRQLLQLWEHGALLFDLRPGRFSKLGPRAQDVTLAAWERSSLVLRRRAFQALRTLVFLGYYRDARTWPQLGYPGPMVPAAP